MIRQYMHIFICLLLTYCPVLAQTRYHTVDNEIDCPLILHKCLAELKNELSPTVLNRFKSEPETVVYDYDSTIGSWIRYHWIRKENAGTFAEYLNKLGIYAPEDISTIILISFWRDLHSQPIRLNEQVARYKRYWFYNGPQVTERRSIPEEIWSKPLLVHTGDTIRLLDFKGSLIILSIVTDGEFGQSTVATLNSLRKKFSNKELKILGLYDCLPAEEADRKKFINDYQPIFPVMFQEPPGFTYALRRALISPGSLGIPQTILIGKDGYMITRFNDWDPKTSPDQLYKEILAALKRQPSTTAGSRKQ